MDLKKANAMRGHKLLTKEIEKKLPALYSQENEKDPVVRVKFFSPYMSYGYWLGLEYDPAQKLFFGYAVLNDPSCGELGYFSLEELESASYRGIPAVERDCSFKPAKLSEVKEKLGL